VWSLAHSLEGRGDLRGHRHRAALTGLRCALAPACVARLDADQAAPEIDGSPAQREKLAEAQAAERRCDEDRRVGLIVRSRHERVHLAWLEEVGAVQRATRFDASGTLDLGDRVGGDPVDLACAPKDPVEVDQVLRFRCPTSR
jgi:hypothetical protein